MDLGELLSLLKVTVLIDNSTLEEQARAVWDLIAIAWAVHVINWGLCRGGLNWILGIRPRQFTGLLGILFAPFLHGVQDTKDGKNNSHIAANTVAFAALGFLVALQGVRLFWIVTATAALFSGIGTWLFGRPAPHVGASGVVYGYMGFLLVYGLLSGNIGAFVLAIVTFFLYGRAIRGVLPTMPRISWEGHLFGFTGGVFIAYLLSYARLIYPF